MHPDFDREVLARLPLAEATLLLWQFVWDHTSLHELYDRHQGRTYQKNIPFPLLAQLVRDALREPEGCAPQSFCQAQPDGILPTVLSSTQDKLAHLPAALSEAFLAEGADRLRPLFADTQVAQRDDPIAASRRDVEILVLDGTVVQRVPRRLRPARPGKGGLLGGKGRVARHLRSGLALALATDPDGETKDAKLVPDLLPQVGGRLEGPRLWLGDRPFGDLIQTAAFVAEGGDHFLVRYPSKVHFYPDPARPAQQGRDDPGRLDEQAWGWLGGERDKRRRSVRRVTLHRHGEEDVIRVTDLLDADRYPAEELLVLSLTRWGIERVFHQITAVFHLHRLLATTARGTLFPLSFGLLLYNRIHVVRGQVAVGQGIWLELLSTELLLVDVSKQRVSVHELVAVGRVVALLAVACSAAVMRQRLGGLLEALWSASWITASTRTRRPGAAKQGKREHTSVYRLLRAHHQSRTKGTIV